MATLVGHWPNGGKLRYGARRPQPRPSHYDRLFPLSQVKINQAMGLDDVCRFAYRSSEGAIELEQVMGCCSAWFALRGSSGAPERRSRVRHPESTPQQGLHRRVKVVVARYQLLVHIAMEIGVPFGD